MPSAERKGAPSNTIAAIATPPGRGGVGIVRVSGPLAPRIAEVLTGKLPPPRTAAYCSARDAGGQPIDCGLALWFPAPHSYTGEDVFEFQGHGGPAVTGEVLRACLAAGAQPAQAGEFTRRAFLNDKLDLAQAEAVADLIDASSAEAARLAMRSLSGEFSSAIGALVRGLIELRALTEAMLDFPEEEVDALHGDDARGRLARIRAQLDEVLRQSRHGSLLREGIRVVIAGRPNVGKSSLLNRLSGNEVAIVTAIPGTTRDALREAIQIDGVPVHVVDTAGLRATEDVIEREGIARAWREVRAADVVLAVFEADPGIGPEDEAILRDLPVGVRRLHVFNKVDLVAGGRAERLAGDIPALRISARTGEGMDLLRKAIVEAAGGQTGGESMFLARTRHLEAIAAAGQHLEAAARHERSLELFAEELRLAQSALSSITGEYSADDLLGEIFSRFCIGK